MRDETSQQMIKHQVRRTEFWTEVENEAPDAVAKTWDSLPSVSVFMVPLQIGGQRVCGIEYPTLLRGLPLSLIDFQIAQGTIKGFDAPNENGEVRLIAYTGP